MIFLRCGLWRSYVTTVADVDHCQIIDILPTCAVIDVARSIDESGNDHITGPSTDPPKAN